MLRRLVGAMLLGLLVQAALAFESEKLAPIAGIVEAQIQAGHIPGAVILIGHEGKVVYRRAFGYRTRQPEEAMEVETIFDLASLTKPIATATAVLQLAERGELQLDAPVARYWPEFAAHGKGSIRIRQLLTHTSGLRAGLDLRQPWKGTSAALKLLAAEKPQAPPDGEVLYSDLNFMALGELVRRVSGQSLADYCREHIFKPLDMPDTGYLPAAALRSRIAPTGFLHGQLRRGEVHDPMAWRMGGVAGHAGVFSTADDLGRFAQVILDGGKFAGKSLLSAESLALIELPQTRPSLMAATPAGENMQTPALCQAVAAAVATDHALNAACRSNPRAPTAANNYGLQPPYKSALRTLGWRADAPLAANRRQLPPVGAIGHNGYTGTSLWIDPVTQTYVVILTHRVHPLEKGDAGPLRERIASVVSDAVGPLAWEQISARQPLLAAHENLPPLRRAASGLQSGIDVLATDGFAALSGLRIGLITHQSGIDATGRRSIDLLRQAPGVQLVALFSPEHGLQGKLDSKVPSGSDAASGLPVFSLYGDTRRPTPEMLAGIDALVFDLQDVGVRFYTYISTMGYAMEAAAAQGKRFIVLDRPNPLGGELVQGPLLDGERRSFTAYFNLPVRHGMTVGELALMFDAQLGIGARPEVVRMRHYQRQTNFDQSGLLWIPPSPNLRNQTAVALYPAIGMLEGANVSVGRGTPTPFEILGAPWIDGPALAANLNRRQIAGVRFEATEFMPAENTYAKRVCHGVRVILLDRQRLDVGRLGIELADALTRQHPRQFELARTVGSIGSKSVVEAIRTGVDPQAIVAAWQKPLAEFRNLRQQYLLY